MSDVLNTLITAIATIASACIGAYATLRASQRKSKPPPRILDESGNPVASASTPSPSTNWKLRLRVMAVGLLAGVIGFFGMVVIRGCYPMERKSIVVGGMTLPESSILLELMAITLEAESPEVRVERKHFAGNTTWCNTALRDGKLDLYAEYSGTLLVRYLEVELAKARAEKFHAQESIQARLDEAENYGDVAWLGRFGFSTSYVMVMHRSHVEALGLYTGSAPNEMGWPNLSDLQKVKTPLSLACEPGWVTREDGLPAFKETYGLEFERVDICEHIHKYDHLKPVAAGSQTSPYLINAYTTDPQLLGEESPYQRLWDNEKFFLKYYPAPFVRKDAIKRYPWIKTALEKLHLKVNVTEMAQLLAEANIENIFDDTTALSAHAQFKLRKLCTEFLKGRFVIP